MRKPLWEKCYEDPEADTFGQPSTEVIELIPVLPVGGRILDLGCGDGRNTIPLAKAGFHVTGVDVSRAGVAKLRHRAQEQNLSVDLLVADMTEFDLTPGYDLIISHGCLHLIHLEKRIALVNRMKDATLSGGYNAVTAFTDTVPAPDDLAEFCVGMLHRGELFKAYSDWEFLLQRSYTFQDTHPGGVIHTHSADKIVARKNY